MMLAWASQKLAPRSSCASVCEHQHSAAALQTTELSQLIGLLVAKYSYSSKQLAVTSATYAAHYLFGHFLHTAPSKLTSGLFFFTYVILHLSRKKGAWKFKYSNILSCFGTFRNPVKGKCCDRPEWTLLNPSLYQCWYVWREDAAMIIPTWILCTENQKFVEQWSEALGRTTVMISLWNSRGLGLICLMQSDFATHKNVYWTGCSEV